MRQRSLQLILGMIAVGLACANDDGGGGDDGADSMSSMGSSGGSGAVTSGSDTGGGPGADSNDVSGSGATSGSTGDGGVSCEPDASDDECNLCTKADCCDELRACLNDPVCQCMTDCATGLNDIPMCTDMCGTSTTFSPLTSCITVSCASECIG